MSGDHPKVSTLIELPHDVACRPDGAFLLRARLAHSMGKTALNQGLNIPAKACHSYVAIESTLASKLLLYIVRPPRLSYFRLLTG